jgi:hypothetical protein
MQVTGAGIAVTAGGILKNEGVAAFWLEGFVLCVRP